MLRKLLIITSLFAAHNAVAQDLVPMFVPSTTSRPLPEYKKTIDYTKMGAPLPEFRLVTLAVGESKIQTDGTAVRHVVQPAKSITDRDVKNNANLILVIFNPNCGHCEDQTDTLKKYIYLFKKSHLVMACAPMMGPYLETFEKDHNIVQYPSIKIGLDSSNLIKKTFLYTNLPQINVYDKERRLIKTFTNGAPIDSLKPYID